MATDNLMNKITLYYSQMTKAEKKVADFVLSSPQEALASTITDLSKHCGVGETSVFRFCRTLELKGYQDFKLSLAVSTSSNGVSTPKDTINISNTTNCQDTAYNVMQAYITALETTCRTLNFNAIPEVVEEYMNKVNEKIGSDYKLFNYYGAEDADEVIISLALAVLVQVQMNLRINL